MRISILIVGIMSIMIIIAYTTIISFLHKDIARLSNANKALRHTICEIQEELYSYKLESFLKNEHILSDEEKIELNAALSSKNLFCRRIC